MDEHPHPLNQPPAPAPPDTPVDAGAQALSEALRSSFFIIKSVTVVLLAVFLASGFFAVGPQQQAVILRFGRPTAQGQAALLGPGPHWSFPYPIDEAVIVSIAGLQQVKSTVGWYATTPEQEQARTEPAIPFGTPMNPAVDGYAITADANIIHARATLTYHISDPVRYLFSFANASNTVRNALDNALLFAASRFKVDDLLTRDVIGFKDAVRRRATELIEKRNLGVAVEECVVEARPPRQLQDAFRNVLEAELRRSTLITDARGFENQTLSRAGAEAASRTNLAEYARKQLVNDVSSRARQFQELLPKYNQNPNLFVQQRLAETLARTLTNVQDKIFLTEGEPGNTKELRLLLNREPAKPKAEETKSQ